MFREDAGVREVDLLPILRDELAAHKAASADTSADARVFVTSSGKVRDRHNLRQRVVMPIVRKADDPAFTLRVYSHPMRRNDGERDRLRALVEGRDIGTDWAPMGTSSHEPVPETSAEALP